MPMTKDDGFRMEPREFYSRREDMSPDGKLTLFMEDDGDIIVEVTQGDRSIDAGPRIASVQFCTTFGGGKSQRVRLALMELAHAIEQDNAELPSFDGWNT